MDVRTELDIEAYKSLNLLDTVHIFFLSEIWKDISEV